MKSELSIVVFFVFSCLFFSCETSQPNFNSPIKSKIKPWTHEQFDESDEKLTFAIFSDLTGGERERIFEVAIAQLNLLRPELIVNVGDLIDGGTSDSLEWHTQWDFFDERANKARAPIFYAGGNHDLTGELAQTIWEARLGKRYYHFIYKKVLFMILDSEDHSRERMAEIEQIRNNALIVLEKYGREALDTTAYMRLHERSSGRISEDQMNYFLSVIEGNMDAEWTFIFMHKPLWERENEDRFIKIEQALSTIPYTVFHGHTHQYNYTERNGRDYINLSTTGGGQPQGERRSVDHVALVTVVDREVSIANLLMEGILDKTGHIPNGGDTLVFER